MSIILERIICFRSMSQLHFYSSIREFKILEYNMILRDSPCAKIMTRILYVFTFGCFCLITNNIIQFYSRIFSSPLTSSCRCIGTSLELCFLELRRRCKGECVFFRHRFDKLRNIALACIKCKN